MIEWYLVAHLVVVGETALATFEAGPFRTEQQCVHLMISGRRTLPAGQLQNVRCVEMMRV